MSTEPTETQDAHSDAAEAETAEAAQDADAVDEPAADDGAEAPAEGDVPPEEEIRQLTEEIEALKAEREEINDKLLRKAAEFENFRRRMEREKQRRFMSGKIEAVKPMLEVLDDFERSMEAAKDLESAQDADSAYESLKGGVDMVFRKMKDELKSIGVEPIEAEGRPFDESVHEAMMRQPAPEDVEPGTVLQEIQTGYRMGDRVIRHSRVIVATDPNA